MLANVELSLGSDAGSCELSHFCQQLSLALTRDTRPSLSSCETSLLTLSPHRLSERNCIEIISKLVQEKKLDVVHTLDGKEYITPAQISREIRDELYVHGGQFNCQQSLFLHFT